MEVFKKIKAECAECGTPLNGVDLLKRGDRYYCPSDYERLSVQEKIETNKMEDEHSLFQKVTRWLNHS